MKLYFWDWNGCGRIECVEMEFPFKNNDEARANDCYTNLQEAVTAAKIDIRNRIKEETKALNEIFAELETTTASNVTHVKYVKGT